MIHPLVLGSGRRMFDEGDHVQLRLVETVSAPTGVIAALYEPLRNG